MPEVVDGPINEEIVVGLAGLEERLTAGDVGVEAVAKIAPERIPGVELGRGVEKPAGPRCVGR
jgi:hypothetical protein